MTKMSGSTRCSPGWCECSNARAGSTMRWWPTPPPRERQRLLLARLAGLARPTAARLVADLGALTGISDPAAEMAMFDQFGEEAVEDRRGEWRLPASYRDARRVLRNG
jgi:hypothetical protein